METIFAFFSQYGLLAVFGVVLIKQLGAPVPASPILLLAGAAAADDGVFAVKALVVATAAATLADFVWFYAGRRFGRRVLALLCRISISPDSCVRKNELSFARRGVATLVIAKFVPGLATLAPPLAGALGMRAQSFAIFNAAGAALWAGAGIAVGLIFHEQIQRLLVSLSELGRMAVWLVAALVALYVAWRMVRRWRELRLHARMPRVQPNELVEMIERGRAPLILDVRTQGPDLPLREGIPGARHIDLAGIETVPVADWPDDVPIVIYCDCPNDASATKAAGVLSKRGFGASILSGGIDGWVQAGYPLEALSRAFH
jgi:membrane protein DedA with SNARE-associated domain/rhodanese-related sulfurtransferase